MKTWKLRLAIILGIFAAVYLAVCIHVLVKQEDLLFDPILTPEKTSIPPIGTRDEEVWIPVGSGRDQGKLHARWIPAADADAPTFLYLHGQTHNNSTHPEHAQRLYQLGYNVLMVDYRGFGRSCGGGQPSEAKLYEDAEAAWNYLTHIIHGKLDVTVPFEMTEQLHAAAPQPKKMLLVELGDHPNSGAIDWAGYKTAVTTFVQTQCNRSIGQ